MNKVRNGSVLAILLGLIFAVVGLTSAPASAGLPGGFDPDREPTVAEVQAILADWTPDCRPHTLSGKFGVTLAYNPANVLSQVTVPYNVTIIPLSNGRYDLSVIATSPNCVGTTTTTSSTPPPGPQLVDICHLENDIYAIIQIAPSAVPAHVAHGDIYPVPDDGICEGPVVTNPPPGTTTTTTTTVTPPDTTTTTVTTPDTTTPDTTTPDTTTPGTTPGTTPEDSVPPGTSPEDSVPPGTTPEGSVPPGTTPTDSTPTDSTPTESTPTDSTPTRDSVPPGDVPTTTTPTGPLPRTGGGPGALLTLGIWLVIGGGAALVISSRRRHRIAS